ncbi:unnamed protein product [Euphydryas editha]|uniref:Uncharacterized protein n=1 Tax=Euphydryas editha TaxID=104508 RepID=A0AAU9UR15_EUPED|nr:unnamed protein product [Euphydryas editha]
MAFTRKNLKCPIFGESAELRDNLLPTYESVIKFYEWTRQDLKIRYGTTTELTFNQIADIVTNKTETLWIKSSIPIVTHKRVLKTLKCYHSKCYNLKFFLKKLKKEKLEEFRVKRRMLFDIAACKCKEFQSCTCRKEKKVPKEEKICEFVYCSYRIFIPPIIKNISQEQIQDLIENGGETVLEFMKMPCHTQAVEWLVKVVTEAALSVCGKTTREEFIKSKLASCQTLTRKKIFV